MLKSLKGMLNKYHAVLAGGTALALQIGHRISEDLDFFTTKGFRAESMISEIRKTGHPFRIISEGEGSLVADVAGIKVSFLKYDYPFLEKPALIDGIQVASVLDIAAMKVIAVSQRGTRRDFIDLFCIIQDMPFYKIAEHMVRRFGKERINPVHIGKSLVYFADAESNPEPLYIKSKSVKWDYVQEFFRHHVKQFVIDLDVAVKGAAAK
ncbi:MAG TPA: nucleotidyl transferase AbiEii/AbiGii toxin family protein [Thermodesulfovibrionales bacterium]|nr:nucleotidyl transferase AbiEii/AbiGii toxin family protein [Thermodesulfovibrionales bacterium]